MILCINFIQIAVLAVNLEKTVIYSDHIYTSKELFLAVLLSIGHNFFVDTAYVRIPVQAPKYLHQIDTEETNCAFSGARMRNIKARNLTKNCERREYE